MYKNIALIALLLPFSGYAQTKPERKKKLEDRLAVILAELAEFDTKFAATWPILMFTMSKEGIENIKKDMDAKSKELIELNDEYQQL